MSITLDYAKRQLRYWQRIVRELRQTKREEKRQTRQREKKGREKISPTPPLKREGERKEKATTTTTHARARVARKPTLGEVCDFAKRNEMSQEFAKRWFKEMDEVLKWQHPKSGKPIYIWQRYLKVWWENHDEFDPLPVATESKQITINTKGLDAL